MIDRLPFRTRLTLVSSAVFGLALLLMTVVGFIAVRTTLDRDLTTRLQAMGPALASIVDVRQNRMLLDDDDRDDFLTVLGGHANGTVIGNDGRIVFSNVDPPAEVRAVRAARGSTAGTTTSNIAFSMVPLIRRGVTHGHVVVWESRAAYDDATRLTVVALAVSAGVLFLIAMIIARLLYRRMLRPLTELSAIVSEIEAYDLSERLAWSGPDDELARLCATFDRLLDRLEAAFARERRFTADASHELRAPLSVIRAELELALRRERSAESYRATLETLARETNRIETLIDGLLLSARRDAGHGTQQRVDLSDAARTVSERMEAVAREREIVLDVAADQPAHAAVDPALLERALLAIIDNALRYAPPAGHVRLHIARNNGSATIGVIDDGPGFTPGALLSATERFWRDDSARSGPSTGLGLSIARALVERSGGSLRVENAEAGGAHVTLVFPAIP